MFWLILKVAVYIIRYQPKVVKNALLDLKAGYAKIMEI